MSERPDKIIAGAAALSICESLLISLQELKIISAKEARAVLVDAAATHRNAIPVSPNGDEHRVIAELIERLIERKYLRIEGEAGASVKHAAPAR